ncbi:Mannan endo-1,4-beta-mannosidase [Seminavis robusta]|uniref:Mannan endo-1,4-beta-mannosidase n=1 Tax=Seminavis robusta TaxID=568900 RepID=A0A9N8E6S6_9STRA|nr:Mannan endo-1,4-beta-mannosidase [Seminavis robusta]|eukprot:Sro682_g186530.1 Mannan endo-1,4-beta-mannosidase (581) ;mRNA; r:39203-40945
MNAAGWSVPLLFLLVLTLVSTTTSTDGITLSPSSVDTSDAKLTSTASCARSRGFQTLEFLHSIRGQKIVSGQHNDQKDGTNESHYTRRVYEVTGEYAGLYGADFLFHGNPDRRWAITLEAERQWAQGAIINLMWHACPPTTGADAGLKCPWDGGILSSLTDDEWNDLITDGGNLNTIWKSRIDEIAVFLRYLQDRNVEVMWRPLHEQNQPVFWWAGRTGDLGTKKLWQLTHNYMTNDLGLTNLIWVWNVQDMPIIDFGDYNPGQEYFDIATLDVYLPGITYNSCKYYEAMLVEAGDRMVAIGESFQLPSLDVMERQPMWTFFMTWAYGLERDPNGSQTNSIDYIREVYNYPRVLKLKDMPTWHNQSTISDCVALAETVCSNDVDCGFNGYCVSNICFLDVRTYHSTEPQNILARFGLERHILDCNGKGISQFGLVQPFVLHYNYYYSCSDLTDATPGAMQQTPLDAAFLGNVIFLDRHAIDCQTSPIQYLHLVSSANQRIGYNYKCGEVYLHEVEDYYTEWASTNGLWGRINVRFLERHDVKCPTGKVLSYVQLQTNGQGRIISNNKMRYHYKCGYALHF